MHSRDKKLLISLQAYFGVGQIYQQSSKAVEYKVQSAKDLKVLLDHFDKYPLITQKLADYMLWRQVVIMMLRKENLTQEDLQAIVNIRASINLGLSDQLKAAFSNTVPVKRAVVVNQVIRDPHWVVGFTSAEGCLFVNIFNVTTKVGVAVQLIFQLTQHCRDKQLMVSLIKYLDCGNVFKNRETVNLIETKFENLNNKIIPFFQKYQILGIKYEDFKDFCLVAYLMKEKKHLTEEGLVLLKIRKIKAGMNRGRDIE